LGAQLYPKAGKIQGKGLLERRQSLEEKEAFAKAQPSADEMQAWLC
jgi:hypothetical protein